MIYLSDKFGWTFPNLGDLLFLHQQFDNTICGLKNSVPLSLDESSRAKCCINLVARSEKLISAEYWIKMADGRTATTTPASGDSYLKLLEDWDWINSSHLGSDESKRGMIRPQYSQFRTSLVRQPKFYL
ncbi:hypothetical protein BpHYR1_000469 [Brachionus plicatilis]|uniref:Uncharacterized protein n=1 Tax=Brachionus plicatilis TaxID=10195 RepID=A0A3M7RN68_BRAPC|nr:hypothetical protein BpHYR1_000469 [Brachionus plicatilis]